MGKLKPSSAALLERRWTRIREQASIEAPIDHVWSVISDAARRPEWYTALDEFVPLGQQTAGVGARFAEREWLWKSTVEIVDWVDGERIGTSTSTLNMAGLLSQLYTEFSLEAETETTTQVTITGGFRLGWFGWLLCAYTYPQMLGYMWFNSRSALKGLRKALDGDESS